MPGTVLGPRNIFLKDNILFFVEKFVTYIIVFSVVYVILLP